MAGGVPQPVTHGPIAGQRAARNDISDDTEPTSEHGQEQQKFFEGVDVWMMDVERTFWMAFCTASEAELAFNRLRLLYKQRVDAPKIVKVKERVHCAWCGERLGGFHHKLGFEYTLAAWEACAIILEGLRPTGITRIDDWLYDWLDMTWCADAGPVRPTGEQLAEMAFFEFNL
jgi:hypothetical protein